MLNLLRVDRFKLIKNKVFWVLVSIIVAIAFISVFLFFLEEKGLIESIEGENFAVVANEQEAEFMPSDGIVFFMEGINAPDLTITVLFISILGAFFIATENSIGTIKNTVSIGYSRQQIYISKIALFSFGAILLNLFMSVAFGVFGSIFFGIGELPAIGEIASLGKVALLSSLYIISFAAIVMLFSMLVKGSGLAILISFVFFLLFGLGLANFGQKYVLFQEINHYSVYYRFMTLAGSDLSNAKVLLELTAVPVVTSIVFIGLGIIVFQKKDIQ